MAATNVVATVTNPAVDFLGALAPGASADADIVFPMAIGAGFHARCRVKHLVILSKDNCAWDVLFYGKTIRATGDPATDSFRSRYRFSASDAISVGGLFYYYVPGLDMPYEDEDRHGLLHLTLINRSPATNKTAGAAGAILVRVLAEVTYGG